MKAGSQHPAERLMQQRLFQFVEGGELALVEGGQALGFFAEGVKLGNDLFLLDER